MSTRAMFHVTLSEDSAPFCHYQHSDGYPDSDYGVLANLAEALATPTRREAIRQGLLAARRVDQRDVPTPEDREAYADSAERVSYGPDREYYALLRGHQGDFPAMAAAGIIATCDPDCGQQYDYRLDFVAGTVTVSEDGVDIPTTLTFDQVVEVYAAAAHS